MFPFLNSLQGWSVSDETEKTVIICMWVATGSHESRIFAQNKNKNQPVHNTEKTEKTTSLTDKGILVLKTNSQERMEAYNPSVSVLSLKPYRKKIQKCGSFPAFFPAPPVGCRKKATQVTEEVLMSCGQTVKGDSHTEGQGTEGPVWDFCQKCVREWFSLPSSPQGKHAYFGCSLCVPLSPPPPQELQNSLELVSGWVLHKAGFSDFTSSYSKFFRIASNTSFRSFTWRTAQA